MNRVKLSRLGAIGVSNDPPPFSIPDNALSNGLNVRASNDVLRNFGGNEVQAEFSAQIWQIFPFQKPDQFWLWLTAGTQLAWVYDGTTLSEITRIVGGPYTLDEYLSRWTGGSQGSIAFLCPGHEDYPQVWPQLEVTQRLENMTYDPTQSVGSRTWADIDYAAYSMRPYKDTIFAMNLNRAGVELARTIQWCDFLSIGNSEPDWVPRTTNSAGEVPLNETTGPIIDGEALRDDFIVYKTDAAYRSSFTGDPDNPFRFERLPEYVRIMNRGCIGAAEEFHVLASRADVQIFDGNSFRSLFDNRLRNYYASQMNADRQLMTFVAPYNAESEIWICFPTGVETDQYADRAIVWNYNDNTMSITDLPRVRSMAEGVIVVPQLDSFDDQTPADLSFDEDTLRFDESPFQTNKEFLIGVYRTKVEDEDPPTTDRYKLSVFGESTTDYDGALRFCQAERIGLVLGEEGYRGTNRVYTVRTVRPYMRATGPVQIEIGAQMNLGDAVIWAPKQSFDPSKDSHLDFRVTGRYFSYRISSELPIQWEITDIEFEYFRRRSR